MEGRKFVELGIEHRIAIVCMTGERPLNTLNEEMLLEIGGGVHGNRAPARHPCRCPAGRR